MRQQELRDIESELQRFSDRLDIDDWETEKLRNLARRIGAEVVRLELANNPLRNDPKSYPTCPPHVTSPGAANAPDNASGSGCFLGISQNTHAAANATTSEKDRA